MRLWEALFVVATSVGAISCARTALVNRGFDIECGATPCEWTVVEGEVSIGPSWHPNDTGAVLSGSRRAVISQRLAPFKLSGREVQIQAAVVVDPGVTVRFEIEWYSNSDGSSAIWQSDDITYWQRGPVSLGVRAVSTDESKAHRLNKLVSSPTVTATGLELRIVKEGAGRAIVDEISLRELYAWSEGI
ncbi:MAG: hypothetical protein HYY84_19390 [Deltaproteobacteria bacterium]|nr:hypothetical protein [Deltaproteobacteria bacterium]